MNPDQMDTLVDEMTAASLQNHSPESVTNRSEGQSSRSLPTARTFVALTCADLGTAHAPPSQATLLGIPQELRNQIFEHVYDVFDKAGERIDMILYNPRTSDDGSDNWNTTQAMIPLWAAPSTRTPTLVCRQIHTEMKEMQAAAVRHYWSTNIFSIRLRFPEQQPLHTYQAAKQRDFAHAEHFALHPTCCGFEVLVSIEFEAGQWTASSDVSEDYLEDVLHERAADPHRHFQPQRPLRRCLAAALANFHQLFFPRLTYDRPRNELYTISGEHKILDPKVGNGLTPNSLQTATFTAAQLVIGSFERAF